MFEKELDIAKTMAIEAGRVTMEIKARGAAVEWKGERDPVTEADKASSRLLEERVRAAFPDDGFLSEEEKDDPIRLSKERVWIVDPLDGTQEFIDGLDHFSVMVGLAVKHRPVLGVVYRPMAGQLLYAVAGQGAWEERDGKRERLHVAPCESVSLARLLASRSHLSPLVKQAADRMGIVRDLVRLGSVGFKVAVISAKAADLYIHLGPGIKAWDTCAPEAILVEAGGKVTDPFGNPIEYNLPDVRLLDGLIASSGGPVHESAVKASTETLAK